MPMSSIALASSFMVSALCSALLLLRWSFQVEPHTADATANASTHHQGSLESSLPSMVRKVQQGANNGRLGNHKTSTSTSASSRLTPTLFIAIITFNAVTLATILSQSTHSQSIATSLQHHAFQRFPERCSQPIQLR